MTCKNTRQIDATDRQRLARSTHHTAFYNPNVVIIDEISSIQRGAMMTCGTQSCILRSISGPMML